MDSSFKIDFSNDKLPSVLNKFLDKPKELKKLLSKFSNDTCSLYVSIPFCPTRCAYCSFVSYSTKRLLSMIPEYLERLFVDIKNTVELIKKKGQKIVTIYIGGGTPTTLSEVELEKLLSCITENVDMSKVIEFTLEAGRPDTLNEEKLAIMKDAGVSRISINPQTFNGNVLKEIGRNHTAEETVEKYLKNAKPLDYLQFQRIGYFNVDKDSTPDHLVFNRTVSLKDTWSKINK